MTARLSITRIVFTFIAILALTHTYAMARDETSRLDRMERDLQMLHRKVAEQGIDTRDDDSTAPSSTYNASSSGGAGVAEMGTRIASLEDTIRGLTGKIEELQHKNDRLSADLASFKQDVEFRFTQQSAGGTTIVNPAASTAGAASAKDAKDAATSAAAKTAADKELTGSLKAGQVLKLPDDKKVLQLKDGKPVKGAIEQTLEDKAVLDSYKRQEEISSINDDDVADIAKPKSDSKEQKEFDDAYTKIKKKDYTGAEKSLQAFIKKYPKSDLTGDAYFWLGETYYSKSNKEQAALQFLRGYKNFPDSKKAPDNLLKLAMTLSEIGKTNEACISFKKLDDQFPKAELALKQKAQSEIDRLGCK